MSRLQKKCLLASVLTHSLALLVLLLGAAFSAGRPDKVDMNVIELVPVDAIPTDGPSHGGSPNGGPAHQEKRTAPPEPSSPEPKQTEPKRQEPEPPPPKPKPEVKHDLPKEPEPASEERAAKPRAPHKVKIDLSKISRIPDSSRQSRENPADRRRRAAARELSGRLKQLNGSLSQGTTVELFGPGGGGPVYGNYGAIVQGVYDRAWIVSDDIDDDESTATVEVTIERSGNVKSARIVKPSGNRALDRSVRAALDRVHFVAPFPKESRDEERTFRILFNLKAKRLLG